MLGFGLGSFAWNVCAPFLPLRLQELGVADLGQVARLAGLLVGVSSLLSALLAPVWSRVGARSGYRGQVIRSHAGTALGWGLFGLAGSPLQMGGAAAVLGGLSGTYPHYVALAAARAAPSEVGRAVGDLQAASQVGNTLGPLVGGLIASQLGVRPTFFVTAALSAVAVGIAVFFLPAAAPRVAAGPGREGARAGAGHEGVAVGARRTSVQRWLMALLLVGDTGIVGLRPLIPVVLSARVTDPAALRRRRASPPPWPPRGRSWPRWWSGGAAGGCTRSACCW